MAAGYNCTGVRRPCRTNSVPCTSLRALCGRHRSISSYGFLLLVLTVGIPTGSCTTTSDHTDLEKFSESSGLRRRRARASHGFGQPQAEPLALWQAGFTSHCD
eukprot:2507365-Rhodomonas_salina.3